MDALHLVWASQRGTAPAAVPAGSAALAAQPARAALAAAEPAQAAAVPAGDAPAAPADSAAATSRASSDNDNLHPGGRCFWGARKPHPPCARVCFLLPGPTPCPSPALPSTPSVPHLSRAIQSTQLSDADLEAIMEAIAEAAGISMEDAAELISSTSISVTVEGCCTLVVTVYGESNEHIAELVGRLTEAMGTAEDVRSRPRKYPLADLPRAMPSPCPRVLTWPYGTSPLRRPRAPPRRRRAMFSPTPPATPSAG